MNTSAFLHHLPPTDPVCDTSVDMIMSRFGSWPVLAWTVITATIVTATDTDSHTGGEITQEDESTRAKIKQYDLDVSVKIKFGMI